MSGPAAGAGARWYARPGLVLPLIGALVIAAALFAPEDVNGRAGDSRLTTYSAEPQGARLFYELAGRLGWRVARRTAPGLSPDPGTIQAVLAPDEPLRAREVHALLEAVRAGGALLAVLTGPADPLADSLRIVTGADGTFEAPDSLDTGACRGGSGLAVPLWPEGAVSLYSLRWTAPRPAGVVVFVTVGASTWRRGPRDERPAVVGFPYGRGRIVVASDPDFLRNDALRVCAYGLDVAAISVLEYLRAGGPVPRRRLAFDEYHQGFGTQPGTVATIAGYLGRTASGHALGQLLAAGLVLLLAAAPRALPPREAGRAERRSPFEHVDALARAYAQVGATRTATARLVRGLRRRLGLAATRATAGAPDAAFLDWVEHTAPGTAADVARVRRALGAPISRRELSAVGDALARIEFSLTNPGS